MDPVDIRRKNFISGESFPYETPTGMVYDSGDYHASMDKALETSDYSEMRRAQEQARQHGRIVGIGITTTVEVCGFGPAAAMGGLSGFESATVRMDSTAGVTVFTGSSPHGQGEETAFAQLAADQLGIPMEAVTVVHGDTAVVPRGGGTSGSRSMAVGGSALVTAVAQVERKAKEIAAALLDTTPEGVLLEGGRFSAEDVQDRSVTWADVAREAYSGGSLPSGMERGLEAVAFWEPEGLTFPFSTHVAQVEIDRETGEVQLTSYVAIDDCGNVINPMLVEGQVHGGIAQGAGQALLEGALWDDSGQLLTGSFMDYAMPFADEFPDFILDRTVTTTPINPLGVKGIGEMATIASTPTIVNAVADALSFLGAVHIDVPIRSEKVWKLLQASGLP
jgi:carbon-monoxide dehydrogenase large subunit